MVAFIIMLLAVPVFLVTGFVLHIRPAAPQCPGLPAVLAPLSGITTLAVLLYLWLSVLPRIFAGISALRCGPYLKIAVSIHHHFAAPAQKNHSLCSSSFYCSC